MESKRKPKMRIVVLVILNILFGVLETEARKELSYYLPDVQNLNSEITTPEEFFGFQIGAQHVSHTQQMFYLKNLAKESDRILFHIMGRTHEERPIIYLYISDSENINKLDEIQKQHLNGSGSKSENENNPEDRPLIVWQGYSIHGNEVAAANAAMVVAYYLAASENPEIVKILKNTVIVFCPSLNPDGMERFASWVTRNKSKTPNSDVQDLEFREVWPNGRTNHYGFDLNRDWLPLQQPESKAKVKLYQMWRPNLVTDHHEMARNWTSFFDPGAPSRLNHSIPDENQQLTKEISSFYTRTLDSVGSLYFSEEVFDDFFIGLGSTYPDIQGGIGVLLEQASPFGHVRNSDYGQLTFPFTIRNHVITSLATLRAGLHHKPKLQAYQRNFFLSQESNTNTGYVFGHPAYSYETEELVRILRMHDIETYRLIEDLKVEEYDFKANTSFYVPLDQRQKQLIRGIFETNTQFQDSIFYDVSAWTLPLAFNLPYTLVPEPQAIEKTDQLILKNAPSFAKSSYAYVLPWEHYLSPKVLYSLQRNNINTYVATEPFSYEGQTFEYGSILIPLQNQDQQLIETILKDGVENDRVPVAGIPTGSTGKVNLGSEKFKKLVLPKIGLVVGEGELVYPSGEVWHLLDTRYQIPVTRLDIERFSSFDLSPYNVLVLGNGYYKNFPQDKLDEWVSRGGTLIVQGSGGKWADKIFPGHFKYKEASSIDTVRGVRYEDMNEFFDARITGGVIVKSYIDRSHPLNFGYLDTILPMFKNNNYVFEKDPLSFRNPVVYSRDPLESGYLHPENEKLISDGSALQVAAIGSGRIINFADDPNFRAFWYGTNRLFMNSIFFGRIIQRRSTR